MTHAVVVCRFKRVGHLQTDAHRLVRRHRPAFVQEAAERCGLHVLEHESGGASLEDRVVDRHDAGVGEPRNAERLAPKALPSGDVAGSDVQEFHEHGPVQNLVARRPHLGRRTGCYVAQQPVAPLQGFTGPHLAGPPVLDAAGRRSHPGQPSPATV